MCQAWHPWCYSVYIVHPSGSPGHHGVCTHKYLFECVGVAHNTIVLTQHHGVLIGLASIPCLQSKEKHNPNPARLCQSTDKAKARNWRIDGPEIDSPGSPEHREDRASSSATWPAIDPRRVRSMQTLGGRSPL